MEDSNPKRVFANFVLLIHILGVAQIVKIIIGVIQS